MNLSIISTSDFAKMMSRLDEFIWFEIEKAEISIELEISQTIYPLAAFNRSQNMPFT